MKNIGVILAGGSGRRVGSDIPKQFLCVAGRTILEHTLERFDSHPQIDEIVVIVAEKEMDRTHKIISEGDFRKVKHIAAGGQERYHSTLAALQLYRDEDYQLLIHDAVRPMVTEKIISDVITALGTCNAVNVVIPATDTIIETDATHTFITNVPARDCLFLVQTPQGFHSRILASAYEKALKDAEFVTTDDCSVVMKYLPEEKIKIVKGDTRNLKFTYAEDLALLEYLLK